ncbi:MAG: metallophosphoesterase [Lachnospiraceae bacterium]|nr:metallophosphoesterase [Lachnospiraceae bacterium]
MHILVISDTHRKDVYMREVISRVGKVDMVFHLGDIEGSDQLLMSLCECPVIIVRGNNDFFSVQERDRVMALGNHRILLTHGHNYGVSFTTVRLAEEAIARNCDIALYGHTHVPSLTEEKGVTLFNPGSLGYPRQVPRKPTYGLIEIDRFEEVHYTICEM